MTKTFVCFKIQKFFTKVVGLAAPTQSCSELDTSDLSLVKFNSEIAGLLSVVLFDCFIYLCFRLKIIC